PARQVIRQAAYLLLLLRLAIGHGGTGSPSRRARPCAPYRWRYAGLEDRGRASGQVLIASAITAWSVIARRTVIALRTVVVRPAEPPAEQAAPWRGLGIVAWPRRKPRTAISFAIALIGRLFGDFRFASGRHAGKHDLCVLHAVGLDHVIEHRGIGWRNPHAAMRDGLAEGLDLMAAVDRVPVLHEEDRMGHWGIVPLLAVPDLVHGRGRKRARRRRISVSAGRHRPRIFLDAVDKDGHQLMRLVDIDQDLRAGLRRRRLGARVRGFRFRVGFRGGLWLGLLRRGLGIAAACGTAPIRRGWRLGRGFGARGRGERKCKTRNDEQSGFETSEKT